MKHRDVYGSYDDTVGSLCLLGHDRWPAPGSSPAARGGMFRRGSFVTETGHSLLGGWAGLNDQCVLNIADQDGQADHALVVEEIDRGRVEQVYRVACTGGESGRSQVSFPGLFGDTVRMTERAGSGAEQVSVRESTDPQLGAPPNQEEAHGST